MAPFQDIADESEDERILQEQLLDEEDSQALFRDPERLAMARAVQRNGGRARSNEEAVAGEDCKDSEGNWTKWVIERCTEEQKKAYSELSELCKQDPVVSWVSENIKLRFLQGYKFDVQQSFNALLEAETWRFNNKCDTLTQEDIRPNLDMKAYGICGQDKEGRLVVFC